jgi:hypothetical protein
MVYVMQIIQLLIGSYIQKDKVASNEGDSFVFELAERAEDEAFKKKLQDFIKKVKPLATILIILLCLFNQGIQSNICFVKQYNPNPQPHATLIQLWAFKGISPLVKSIEIGIASETGLVPFSFFLFPHVHECSCTKTC